MGKKDSLSPLIKKLDDVFSKFIRLRDSDKSGYCRCISCGELVYWKYIQNGHFIPRMHMNTRFDEYNCNAQCNSCNCHHHGNEAGYREGLIRKYGGTVLDILSQRKNKTKKWDRFDIIELLDRYKGEVKSLIKEKQLN